MKKILKGACIVALVALAFTSCKKNDNKAHSFFATVEQTEDLVGEDERVYITPGNNPEVYFEQGEQVLLYNIDYAGGPRSYYGVYTSRTTGPQTPFDYQSGPIIDHLERADAFFAFYPGQRVNNAYLSQNNYVIFDVPNRQTYREINGVGVLPERSFAMASKRDDINTLVDATFPFQPIMGALVLELKTNGTPRTITSIVYEDNTFNVAGDVHVKIHEVDPVEMTWLFDNYNPDNDSYMHRLGEYLDRTGYFVDGDAYGKTMTLDCGDGVEINGTAKPFNIALRPLAFHNGAKITVNFANGDKAVLSTTANCVIKPNKRRILTGINVDNFIVP